jgi:hypothetical protein
VNPIAAPNLRFGFDSDVDKGSTVVGGVFQPVQRVHVAGAGDDDGRCGVAAGFGVAPRLMGDGSLVAGDEKADILPVGNRLVQRQRLFARNPEHRVDAAGCELVDDSTTESHTQAS